MDNGWARLVVFLFGDPHLLEGGQGGQDGATDPYRVFPLRWSNDLDLHCGRGQSSDFLLHTVGNAWVHGGTTRQHCIGVQVLTDINITLHDAVVGGLVDTTRLHTQERWLEQGFWAPEPLVSDGDHLAIRKLIALLKRRGGSGGGHFLLKVEGDIAEFFLNVTDDLTLSSGGEGVATLCEDLHQVVGEIPAGQIQTENGVGEGISLVDGHGVSDTITRVEYDTSGTTRGVQRQYSLDGHVHGRGVEGLEHDLKIKHNYYITKYRLCKYRFY